MSREISEFWRAADTIIEQYAESAADAAYESQRGMDGQHHHDLACRDYDLELVAARQRMYEFFTALGHFCDDPDAVNWAHAAAAFAGMVRR